MFPWESWKICNLTQWTNGSFCNKKEQDGRAVLIYQKNHVDLRILRRLQLTVQVQLHMQLA